MTASGAASTPSPSFTEALASRVLLCDGAMGTLAQATGFRPDGPGVELAAIAPELVAALHQRYLDAGADVIETHTFGASRLRLDRHGLGRRTREINRAAAEVATSVRDAAGRPVWVAGSVSPAGPLAPGRGPEDPRPALREQVEALAAGGVDLILLETFSHAEELAVAVSVVGEATDLPVIAQATFVDEDGTPTTVDGESPTEVLHRVLEQLPDAGSLAAVGTNCTLGPQGLLRVVREMAGDTAIPLAAQPNAGLPHVVGDRRVRFAADAEHFARYTARYVAAGARLVGGCCGTTPEHTAAAARALAALAGPDDAHTATTADAHPATLQHANHELAVEPMSLGPALRAALAGGEGRRDGHTPDAPATRSSARGAVERWVRGRQDSGLVAVEVAGRGETEEHVARARAAAASGADLLWVSRPRAVRNATSPADLAVHLQDQLDADVALTVTSWDASLMTLQADLLGLHALGVHTVVCETGNPPVHGDAPVRAGSWEVDAVGLLRLAAGLNRGVDADGHDLGTATAFRIGARLTPGADDPGREALRAAEKVDAGAEFLVSRPVYELDRLADLLQAVDRDVPVLLSVTPLSDFAHAEYMRHEVPGVVLPDGVLERMRRSTDPAATGLEIAEEFVDGARTLPGVAGIVLRWPGTPGRGASATMGSMVSHWRGAGPRDNGARAPTSRPSGAGQPRAPITTRKRPPHPRESGSREPR